MQRREPIAKEIFLTKSAKAYLEIQADETVRPYLSLYYHALLLSLGIRNHRFQIILQRKIASLPARKRKSIVVPRGDQEPDFLDAFANCVRQRFPRIDAVFADDLPRQLRRLTCFYLSEAEEDPDIKEKLHVSGLSIPLVVERQWDNPIRFDTDPKNGAPVLSEITARTPFKLIMDAQAFLRALEPLRQSGRQKGITKPSRSGRKPSGTPEQYVEAHKAEHRAQKYQSPPWWLTFARNNNIPFEDNEKGRDALRTKMREWSLKGKAIARKIDGG